MADYIMKKEEGLHYLKQKYWQSSNLNLKEVVH